LPGKLCRKFVFRDEHWNREATESRDRCNERQLNVIFSSGTVPVPDLVLAATIIFGGGVYFGEPTHVASTFHIKVIKLIGILLSISRNVFSRHRGDFMS
jgi:hypothetical protein